MATNPLVPLNLPPFDWQLRRDGETLYLYDIIRKKHVQLTPEEWVRQHFIHYLLEEGYAKGRLQLEGGLSYNTRQKRADIVTWDAAGQPHLLVECKAPHIKLSDSVWAQATLYNQVRQAPFVAITNGLQHIYGQWQPQHQTYQRLAGLPAPR